MNKLTPIISLYIAFLIIPLVQGQPNAFPGVFSDHVAGSALQNLNPFTIISEMVENENVIIPLDSHVTSRTQLDGGSEPLGIANGRWSITLQLPKSEWGPFKKHFEAGIRQALRDAGSGTDFGEEDDMEDQAFNGSRSFSYRIKGKEDEMDMAGSLMIWYLKSGEEKVSIMVHVFEVEMDVEARIKRAPAPPNEPDLHETYMAMWEAHPTAREVRAQQQRKKELALAYQQEEAANLVVYYDDHESISILRPELEVQMTKPEHLQKLDQQEIEKDLVVVILGKRVMPEDISSFQNELADTFHQLGFQRVILQQAQGDIHPDGLPILLDSKKP
ncbi:MAG: hypothetical protein JJU29_03165 [Verrucomicrobia bacterium]|nr:hypothetical protein [Verrucomicrobiota bacterium]